MLPARTPDCRPRPPSLSRPPRPPRLSLLGLEGQGGGGTETLGCGGAWIPASVLLPKKTGCARGRAPGGPRTDMCPPPFLAPTLCPGGCSRGPLLVERLPGRGRPVGKGERPPPA